MSSIHENRPLSPHLGIYRWQITNTLSILHRMTGVGLSIGLVPLALWLWSAAYDPQLFLTLSDLAGSLVGKVFLFGWTVAFFYHYGNGLRHLNWDLGYGFKIEEATASGWIVVAFALAMSVFTWAIIIKKVGL